MSYFWLKYLHIASAVAFVAIHGTSMAAFYAVRTEQDRARIQTLLAFSGKTVVPMYVSLGAVVVTGVLVGLRIGAFDRGWGWASLILLAGISVYMWFAAKPIHRRIQEACELRPSGVPRVADEDLAAIVGTSRTHVVAWVGGLGIAALVYLMMFKPF
jgi:hypothetical protein